MVSVVSANQSMRESRAVEADSEAVIASQLLSEVNSQEIRQQ